MSDDFKPFLAKVANGKPLARAEAEYAFDIIMSGKATPAQMGGFLMALRVRGEVLEEITGAVTAMYNRMLTVDAPPEAIDVVGTGGDGSGSYNVSTCTAFVVAACGVPVAKHGNRAVSSQSGAADVLTALGVNVNIAPERISACIREANIGFMFAPNHHAAMRHVSPVRAELGVRTIFNLLGPLANPAGVKRQLLGVYARHWVEPLAFALHALGTTSSWVVHGSDGLDELTTTGLTYVAELKGGRVRCFDISPEDAGLSFARPEELLGGDGATNAIALRSVLSGKLSAYRNIVVLNAAAALVVADAAPTLLEGARKAQQALDSGKALEQLEKLIYVSNQ
jgi:anthranilate phosphoribosyltransferase